MQTLKVNVFGLLMIISYLTLIGLFFNPLYAHASMYCPETSEGEYKIGCFRDIDNAVHYCEENDSATCPIMEQSDDFTERKTYNVELPIYDD